MPAHPRTPIVTVLLAAYNAEAFLQRAVDSALAQSIDELELIIVDDASTDETTKLVERLAETDRRIRLLRQSSNGGPAAARNAGLDAATGEWIAVLDADDAYMPHRLERMVQVARMIDADVVLGNFRYHNPETGHTGSPALKEGSEALPITLAEFLSKARPYTGEADWGLLKPLMKRSFLQRHELRYPVFSRHGEDFLFLVEAFLCGASCAVYPEASYLYTSRHEKYSRTIVNYQLMWQHAAELMNDPRIRNDLVVLGCLRDRVAAVRRLSAETDLARARREGAYGFLASRFLSDATFRSMLWDKAWQKLSGPGRH